MGELSRKEELLMGIVNCELAQARSLLEVTNGNIDEAVNLFMEGIGSHDSQPVNDFQHPSPRVEDVRAPIPVKHEQMLDDEDEFIAHQEHMLGRSRGVTNPARDPFRSFAAERKRRTEGKDSTTPLPAAKGAVLAELFRPPLEITFQGTFEAAKAEAEKTSKLLLVNIQTPSEFGCQRLNRDTWRDEKVRQLAQQHFVFWQQEESTPAGRKFKQFYQVIVLPHIAVIDPQTGEKLEAWEGFIGPADLLLELNKVRGRPAAVRPAPALVGRKKSVVDLTEEEQLALAITASQSESSGGKVARDLLSLSSDSVEESKPLTKDSAEGAAKRPRTTGKPEKVIAPTAQLSRGTLSGKEEQATLLNAKRELENAGGDASEVMKEFRKADSAPSMPDTETDRNLGESGECVLQVRLRDGKTLQGRFEPNDKVSTVHAWVARRTNVSASSFVLASSFPRTVYSGEKADLTLAQAKLTPRAALFVQDL